SMDPINATVLVFIGVDYRTPAGREVIIVRPHLLLMPVVAVAIASAVGTQGGAAQNRTRLQGSFAMRVVASDLANPFQVIWGPDGYLWVTERTAGRVTRILPSDGSKTPALTISDFHIDGPGGLLGMSLDPGLLKKTGNDYVYIAYTY